MATSAEDHAAHAPPQYEWPTLPGRAPAAPPDPDAYVVDDDGDYQYYWSAGGLDIPIPRWLAEIIDVPLIVRLEIFLIGVCAGLIFAALAVLIAFYSAV